VLTARALSVDEIDDRERVGVRRVLRLAWTTTQPVESSQRTTTTNDSGHSSVLGATANFVWTVVAFPFRVVGDVIGEIV
jgi:hypothetical protein